jgi:hypothetical protein
VEGSLHPLPEREEEDDREGSPADREDREGDPLPLSRGVVAEELEDEAELGDEGAHYSFRAWTGSRRDARRAGK